MMDNQHFSRCRLVAIHLVLLLAPISADPREWTVFWKDDFTGPEGSPPDDWIFDIGNNWGMGQSDYDTDSPENVSLDGKGNLRITPLRDTEGNWTSGRIETKQENFRPPPGGIVAIEGRIQIPNVSGEAALGYWPAFWAKGSPSRHGEKWPEAGEIDILESVNGENRVWGTLHCGVSRGGPCKEPSGLSRNRPCPGQSCESAYHIYRFEWDDSTSPKEMRWYVDAKEYNKVTSDQMDVVTWDEITNHPGYFILLDVAMGGGLPNGVAGKSTPTSATVPGYTMLVDYVVVLTSV